MIANNSANNISVDTLTISGTTRANPARIDDNSTSFFFNNNLQLESENSLIFNVPDLVLNNSQTVTVNAGSMFVVCHALANGTFDLQNPGSKVILGFGNSDTADQRPEFSIAKHLKVADLTLPGGTGLNNAGTISSISGFGGASGTRYTDVIQAVGSITDTEGDTALKTNDYYYMLENEDSTTLDYYAIAKGGNLFDVLVRAACGGHSFVDASNSVCSKVTITDSVAKTLDIINADSSKYSSGVQNMMASLGTLTSQREVEQAEIELSGTDSMSTTSSVSINSLGIMNQTIRSQMTRFRLGNISSIMSSSFSGTGSTTAVDNTSNPYLLSLAFNELNSSETPTTRNKTGTFFKVFGVYAEQGSASNGYAGHNSQTFGFITGIDYAVAPEIRLGTILGYSYSQSEVYNNLGEGKDNTIRSGVYASLIRDNFFDDLSALAGLHLLESRRNIMTVLSKVATGKRTGFDYSLQGNAGYNLKLGNDILLTPETGVNFTSFYDPAYTETGADGANLHVSEHTTNSLTQDFRVRLGKLLNISDKVKLFAEL